MKNKIYISVPNIRNLTGRFDLPEEILEVKEKSESQEIIAICRNYNYKIRIQRGKMIAMRMKKDSKK